MARRRLLSCAATVSVAALLTAGCSPDDEPQKAVPLPKGESLGELRRQAHEALAWYDKAAAVAGPSATVSVSPPPWNSPPGIAIEKAKGARTATQLTVTFTGTRGPATEPCGADYYAEAVESGRAVVVIVTAQPHAYGEVCTMIGYQRTATVNLAQPLGERAVLEVRQGQPVPVDRS